MKKKSSKPRKTREVRKVNGILPAPKGGPTLTVRMRSEEQIKQVHKAAQRSGLSANTWMMEVLSQASQTALA